VARPRLEKKRDQQLNVSLTKDEFAEVYWRARKAGKRMVDYARWRLLGGASQPVTPPSAELRLDAILFSELRRLGNNLNQLVRICHATRKVPPNGLEGLLARIRDIINRGIAS
jgi:hypothetical protein